MKTHEPPLNKVNIATFTVLDGVFAIQPTRVHVCKVVYYPITKKNWEVLKEFNKNDNHGK